MKLVYTILFFFFSCGPIHAQMKFEWYSNIEFESVMLPGKFHKFYQMCIPTEDSLVANGTATFMKAKLPDIGLCKYSLTFADTIYTKCEISTYTSETTASLIEFVKKTTNHSPTIIADKRSIVYSTIGLYEGEELLFTILTDRKQQKAILSIVPVKFLK